MASFQTPQHPSIIPQINGISNNSHFQASSVGPSSQPTHFSPGAMYSSQPTNAQLHDQPVYSNLYMQPPYNLHANVQPQQLSIPTQQTGVGPVGYPSPQMPR